MAEAPVHFGDHRAGRVCFALILLLVSAGCAGSGPPSIIVIMVDTLRADYLGSYGFDGQVSPYLDRLASESVVFENCFSQAPWTKPSIASLFTSLHPMTHGVLTHRGRYGSANADSSETQTTESLAEEAVTLAELLGSAGYATAAFVANPWIRGRFGFSQGFEVFDEIGQSNSTPAEDVYRPALSWLNSRSDDRPFFLYLHFMDVHAPYDAPESDYEALRTSENLQVSHRLDEQERRAVPGYMRRQPWLQRPDSVELKSWRGRYAAGVRAFDRRVSVFLEQLRSAGVLDDSLVVVTSDHGEELLEHGDWDHGHSLYEHQTRIPLMLRFPEAVGGGARLESMASLIDLMPTLLSVGGIDPPQGLHGRNLLPLVEGELPERQVSFANGVQWKPGIHSLRTPRYKLIADLEQGVVQLFDLDEEPLERNDVAATHPQVAEDLGRRLRDYLIEVAASPALRPESVELDEELKRRLEALGYF